METSAGFWLLAVLLLAATSFSQDQTVKYFKVGDTLQLSPQPVSEQIYSVVWKYGKNLLAEWVKDQIPLTYYSKFIGRTTLNTSTGVLEIRDMTAADTGVYSVEINNQVQSQVYKTVAVEAVPQPEVSVMPLLCNSTSESCTLSCDGDVSAAGPVEYFWKIGDGEWKQSGTNMEIINNEETQRVPTFSCRMKNRVSERETASVSRELRGLSCDGDADQNGPVEYFWKKDDGEWEQSGKKMEILNNEETACENFLLQDEEPVDSRPSLDPLITNDDDTAYRDEIQRLSDWCNYNNLTLNTKKTKEVVMDFCRTRTDPPPLSMKGDYVERVSSFKFLGTHISEDRSWSTNT
ncbi:uncharacterized protein LOC143421853 [Maylandia zebra]|uniref:uncharacterized protein LOC143421853 n=1 Tax=Maylandia zebra TaxID=106582 RepID=UPI00403D181B